MIGFRVPEKTGDPDHQVPEKQVDLGRVFLEIKDVIRQRLYLMNRQATFNATGNGARFVMGKIVAGGAADQRENFLYLILNRRFFERDFIKGIKKRVPGIMDWGSDAE